MVGSRAYPGIVVLGTQTKDCILCPGNELLSCCEWVADSAKLNDEGLTINQFSNYHQDPDETQEISRWLCSEPSKMVGRWWVLSVMPSVR